MANINWRLGFNGSFETARDWSTNTVPGANDNVAIIAPGTYTVSVNASHTIKSLTTTGTATLAVMSGVLTITGGTGAGANAGTIKIGNGAALETGGTFKNTGKINIDSTGRATALIIAGHVTLTGGGSVILSDNAHNEIVGLRPTIPFFFFPPLSTLTNVNNTISGAGTIGTNLTLINEGRIIGDGSAAALIVNTATRHISNSGVMEGTTAKGLDIVSSVNNTGTLEAFGTNARLELDGTVTNTARGGVTASGTGAHIDLSSATISGGALRVGAGDLVQTLANTGFSSISGVNVSGQGTLEANQNTTLNITGSTVSTSLTLATNGHGSVLAIDGTVGALSGTIGGGLMEFKGSSAANINFTAGQVGTLKLDSSFTGEVSGFGGHQPLTFSNFFAFGDSTVDSGALQFLSSFLPSPPNPGLTTRLAHALAAGGTDSPVGVGAMNSQLLAQDFGALANTAYTVGGGIGSGTNYAISGALDASDAGNGNEPGNGSVSNINQAGKPAPDPHLLSTVDQIESYLASNGGVADPSALYLFSSGGNDVTYANNFITDPTLRAAYLAAQAQTLANEIETLAHAGAQHIIVDGSQSNSSLATTYTQELFADLDASGITYTKSDTHALVQDVIDNPTAYGFTSTTVHPGVVGLNTESALIEPDTTHNLTGWGLWGADTTTPDPNGLTNQQYAYLAPATAEGNAEQTHFFSDDQHLSAAGQQIEANLDFNLISDDAIDLTSLNYVFGHTGASFSGNTVGGTLSVSNGAQSFNISLLGDFTNSAFMTASDGTGGTLVLDQGSLTPPQLLALTQQHTA